MNRIGNYIPISALFDTGCDHTTLSGNAVAMLDLLTTGNVFSVMTAGNSVTMDSTEVSMMIRADDGTELKLAKGHVAVLGNSPEMVIMGRDFLADMDVSILRTGEVRLSW